MRTFERLNLTNTNKDDCNDKGDISHFIPRATFNLNPASARKTH